MSTTTTEDLMTPYYAVSVIEGFSGDEPADWEILEAWAYLIKSGDVWKLQGFYGRNASRFIESGLISREGVIDRDMLEAQKEVM